MDVGSSVEYNIIMKQLIHFGQGSWILDFLYYYSIIQSKITA